MVPRHLVMVNINIIRITKNINNFKIEITVLNSIKIFDTDEFFKKTIMAGFKFPYPFSKNLT